MSDEGPRSTPEGREAVPEDELDQSAVEVPDDKDVRPMTLRELREAAEDESHPRHAEAVRRSNELAEQLRPSLERLRQTVMEQPGVKDSLARVQETMAKATSFAVPRYDLSKSCSLDADIPKVDLTNPAFGLQRQWQRSMQEQQKEVELATDAVFDAWAERQRLEYQRAEHTLDVLASMDAHLAQLNSRIESVDARIESGNASTARVARWTILVAVLTLVATVAGIVVTVLLN